MVKKEPKKKLGADLPAVEVEQFSRWVNEHNASPSGAAVAALRLLQVLPLRLRDLAMTGKWDIVSKWLEQADYLMARDEVERRTEAMQKQRQPRRAAGRR